MAVDCSELAKLLTDIAMNVGSRPDVKNLDGVVKKMENLLPGITRQAVVDAIVETTEGQGRQVDALVKKLNEIKAEARTDKGLQRKISNLQGFLEKGAVPLKQTRSKKGTEAIEALRSIRDDLKKKLAKSEPVQKEKLKKQIADLTKKIESGDILPKRKAVEIPQSKELERLQFQRDEIQRRIRRKINALKPRTMWEHIAEPFNTARGLITSMDLSAVLRQGGFAVFSHPVRSARAIGPMLKALSSKQRQSKINDEILNRPNAPLYRKAKLFIAPIDGTYKLSEREEIMQAKLLDKIPFVAASNRAYTTFLNLVRADSFDTLAAGLSKDGEVTLDEAKALANFVNVSTGRGSLGSLERAALPLNTVFFAPRYVASRFQLLSGQPFFRGNARTRKAIAKEYARYLIGLGLVYALGLWSGGEIEKDPRSSDFGKIKFGKTRVDPLSGISQVTVLLSRLVSGKTKSSTTGRITPLRGEKVPIWSGGTPEVVARFMRSKLSPMFGTTLNLAAGENVIGEPVTLKNATASLTVPLAMRDVFETTVEQGLPKGAALSLLAIFGMGMQTYGSQMTPKLPSRKELQKQMAEINAR